MTQLSEEVVERVARALSSTAAYHWEKHKVRDPWDAYARVALEYSDRAELYEALAALEPHLDAIICYASTMGEHEPNRLAFNARVALAKARGEFTLAPECSLTQDISDES
jgi:hypothetical protein